jgi:hypothetical protein
MKTAIVLILSCISVIGADTNDARVVTEINTNTQPGILITFDVFTRGGETNLLRDTRTEAGALRIRTQRFYHEGSELGGYMTYPKSSIIYSAGQSPYSLSFQCDASNNIRSALISSNAVILDAFSCTNGVFYPEDSSFIRRARSFAEGFSAH